MTKAPAAAQPVRTLADGWSGALRSFQPVVALAGFVSALAAVHFATRWQVPLPFCALRKLTGIPCPGCGSTRSLLAWSEFELGQALYYNPLCFVACVAVTMWAALWLSEKVFNGAWLVNWEATFVRWLTWRTALVLAGLNWVYLLFTLPK
jgi:hypothetical protein